MFQTILDALMVLIIAGATYYDCHVTTKQIGKYGPSIELNPVVRHFWASGYPKAALILGIVVPSGIATLVPAVFGLSQVVGFVAGAKSLNAYFQWYRRS